ncbi:MAG: ABC transporter substrate-binding protein [Paracoccaceae bacterium]
MKNLFTTAALALALSATVASSNPYEKYRGTTLNVSWPALGHFINAESAIEDFERETGINVEVEAIPYLDLRERQIGEMSKVSGDFDLVSWVVMWKGEYVSQGFLEPLAPYFADATLADPDFDMTDISRAYIVSGGMVGGPKGYLDGPGATLYGLPYGAETSILAYRKDIFREHNIPVPTTYKELEFAINELAKLGIPAMTSRGNGASNLTFAWLLHLGPKGGRVFDENWQPIVNSPEAVEAAEFLRLVVETGPEDIPNYNFGQSTFAFLSGEAAMYLDNFKIGSASREPNFAFFKDEIGFASHPTGKRCSAETGGFAIGIPRNSENKEAAFLLLQYLTSKEGDMAVTEAGGDPIRISTFIANQRSRAESSAVVGSLMCADTDWRPLIPEWSSIQKDVLGPALLEVTTSDRPVQDIMDEANAQLRTLMDEAGYYSDG